MRFDLCNSLLDSSTVGDFDLEFVPLRRFPVLIPPFRFGKSNKDPNCDTPAARLGNLQHDEPRLFYLSTRGLTRFNNMQSANCGLRKKLSWNQGHEELASEQELYNQCRQGFGSTNITIVLDPRRIEIGRRFKF